MADMAGQTWTQLEVELIVQNYMAMLSMQLRGESFVKSQLNEEIRKNLNGRTTGSVEYKFRNISAVLAKNGWPHVVGYKPAANLQLSLGVEVERVLRLDRGLENLAERATAYVEGVVENISAPDVVKAPEEVFGTAEWTPRSIGIKRDYIYRDQLNLALGLNGERAAVRYERTRLTSLGRPDLAEKVEHISETQGDGLGYDVKSFEIDGADRHIEVKTTTHSAETAFFVSDNEVRASEFYADSFHLFRFFNYTKRLGLFVLAGSISSSCTLQASSYLALPSSASSLS
jgi:hypothetical protein